MNLKEGDKLVKQFKNGIEYEHTYTVDTVKNGYVMLENGDYVPIREIEKELKNGRVEVKR